MVKPTDAKPYSMADFWRDAARIRRTADGLPYCPLAFALPADEEISDVPPAGWVGYVTVVDGQFLKPSRHIPDGTYALIDFDTWKERKWP